MSGAISLKLWRLISSKRLQTHRSPPAAAAAADFAVISALSRDTQTLRGG